MPSLPSLSIESSRSVRRTESEPPAAGILHIGLGNFHRAHQALYTESAVTAQGGDWGILGVANSSPVIVDAMKKQDLLYTVAQMSSDGAEFVVPRIHTDVFVAATDPERVVTSIADSAIRIVSLTVTEHGYSYNRGNGSLDLDGSDIRHDLGTAESPRSTIGRLVRGLQRRLEQGAEPITILSCDNLMDNGHHTMRLVTEFAASLPSAEQRDLVPYIRDRVTFPSTMVDRIVPESTDEYRQLVADRLGYRDSIPVPTEPFTMWILEDRFAGGRPAWEAAGAVFSDEVGNYEQLKLRLLNGTHSLIAYVGALNASERIPDAMTNDGISRAARTVLRNEYLPSVEVPSAIDPDEYEAQLFSRWTNTVLGDRTSRVGTDGSVKLGQRIPVPALRMLKSGAMPQHLALTVAGYLSCMAPFKGRDLTPQAIAMQDPARQGLVDMARQSSTGREYAQRAIAERRLLGDEMAGETGFIDRVGHYIDMISNAGILVAVEEAFASHNA